MIEMGPHSRVAKRLLMYFVLPHILIKVPRPGDSEGTFMVFESSCHLLSASPKDTISKLACCSHYPFNAERHAGKL